MNEFDFDYLRMEVFEHLKRFEENFIEVPTSYFDSSKDKPRKFTVIELKDFFKIMKVVSNISTVISKYDLSLYFRGQRKYYEGEQRPSLIRALIKLYPTHYDNVYNDLIPILTGYYIRIFEHLRSPTTDQVAFRLKDNFHTIEGILQHYGIRTRYMDLFQDPTKALFFSYKNCLDKNEAKDIIHGENGAGFLFCYGIGRGKRVSPGITETENQRIVTLRETLPHQALRPHVQQASVMIDKRLIVPKDLVRKELLDLTDYSKFVLFAIKVPRETLNMMFGTEPQNFFTKCDTLFPKGENDSMLQLLKDFEGNLNVSASGEVERINEVIDRWKEVQREKKDNFTISDIIGSVN